jgi:hypothetical protein
VARSAPAGGGSNPRPAPRQRSGLQQRRPGKRGLYLKKKCQRESCSGPEKAPAAATTSAP